MTKKIIFIFLVFSLISCKNRLYNYAFQTIGAFDEKVSIKNFNYKDKDIVFIPMVHVSTPMFYNDVKHKVDSLSKLEYSFYLESVEYEDTSNEEILKFRKIIGIGIPAGGYQNAIDSILLKNSIKLKKEIVLQPKYSELNLDDTNSKIVDANVGELIKEFEKKYGKIVLEKCDTDVPNPTKNTTCKKIKGYKEKYDAIVLDYRNEIVAKNVVEDSNKKIAIIYGGAHYPGIKKYLDSIQIKK